ncbi:MAG: SURF1 family protein [Actinomycetota bacterium]|nr:SURF1 family protein [Actinomycetota bacterium]
MLAALRTRRWQGFTVVVLVAIIGFGFLSRWQWPRAEEKRVAQQAQTLAEQTPVVPNADETLPEFTAVTLTGQYATDSVRFVRQRPLEGRNGYWVLQLLQTEFGDFWVLRGWVPAGARTDTTPDVSSPPGQVTVNGFVRPLPRGDALTNRGGLPADQVTEIASAQLPVPGDAPWYVQAQQSVPEESVTIVPVTRPDELQNVSYAVQWLLFAAVAIGGWFYFLRREAKEAD